MLPANWREQSLLRLVRKTEHGPGDALGLQLQEPAAGVRRAEARRGESVEFIGELRLAGEKDGLQPFVKCSHSAGFSRKD